MFGREREFHLGTKEYRIKAWTLATLFSSRGRGQERTVEDKHQMIHLYKYKYLYKRFFKKTFKKNEKFKKKKESLVH